MVSVSPASRAASRSGLDPVPGRQGIIAGATTSREIPIGASKDVTTIFGEVERNYDPAAAGMAALEAVQSMLGVAGVAAVSQQDEQILDAGYYDTAALRLIRADIALQRRTGGEDAAWHLKLPAGVGAGRNTPAAGRTHRQGGPRAGGWHRLKGGSWQAPGNTPPRGCGVRSRHS